MDINFDEEIKKLISDQAVNLDDSAVGINEKGKSEEKFSLADLQDTLYEDKAPEDRIEEALKVVDPKLEALLEELRDKDQPAKRVVNPNITLKIEKMEVGDSNKDKDDKELDEEGPLL